MDIHHLIFNIVSYVPGPLWLALWLAPENRWTHRAVDAVLVVFCLLFALLALPDVPRFIPIIANPTLEVITQAYSSLPAMTLAWTQFIIGDLWIGRWIAIDSHKEKLPQWARFPLLLLTLFFGPLGLCVYFLVRSAKRKSIFTEIQS